MFWVMISPFFRNTRLWLQLVV